MSDGVAWASLSQAGCVRHYYYSTVPPLYGRRARAHVPREDESIVMPGSRGITPASR